MTIRTADNITMTQAEFHALTEKLSNWGKWGADDKLGTLNYLTDERRAAAGKLVTDGTVVSCANDITSDARIDTPQPPLHIPFWNRMKDFGVAGESLTIQPHGWFTTHLDSLSHLNYQGKTYNGHDVDPYATGDQTINSIMAGKDGIVGRGVLIDLPALNEKDWLDPGEAATMDDIEKALAAQNTEILPGDILYFYTGRWAREAALGVIPASAGLAGVSIHCAEWVHENQISSMVCDAGMDPQPPEVEAIRIPWHIITLVSMGMMITDNANMEQLAATCRAKGRYEFMTALAPLRLPKANSSPINPLAIF